MSHILHFTLTLFFIIISSVLISFDRRKIKIFHVFQLLLIELLLSYLIFHSNFSFNCLDLLSMSFEKILNCANQGIDFVFNNMNKLRLACFFLEALCPIVFISALISIFQYIRILPLFMWIIGKILSKISGMSMIESFNAIGVLILGQSGIFITYKNLINNLSNRTIYNITVTAISTTSMSIVNAYTSMISIKYIVASLILNIFSTFIVLSIVNPYISNYREEDFQIENLYKKQHFFEMLEEHILSGFKIVIIITAMLMGLISIIYFLNKIFLLLIKISFQDILSYLFYPIAWLIDIPNNEILKASNIMATKIVSNEFLAMINLKKLENELSNYTIGVLSVFLVSFSNFSSIGIISSTVKELNKNKSKIISNYSIKILFNSILINLLSVSVSSLMI